MLVTFDQACAYAQKVGARLPSEAEWQRAAAGPEGRAYPWGDEPDSTRLTMAAKATTCVERHPDGASCYGVQDMAGNVCEWVTDVIKGRRLVKGGNFRSKTIEECRCDARRLVLHDTLKPWVGFRCVLD